MNRYGVILLLAETALQEEPMALLEFTTRRAGYEALGGLSDAIRDLADVLE